MNIGSLVVSRCWPVGEGTANVALPERAGEGDLAKQSKKMPRTAGHWLFVDCQRVLNSTEGA